ncbi:MAG: transglutaminase domain-containing protein [Candidatus Acidiferrales bacterium]
MRRLTILAGLLLATCAVPLGAAHGRAAEETAPPSRSFEFTYIVHVPALPAGSHAMRIWIPLPQTAAHQRISDIHIDSPVRYRIAHAAQDGNRFAYLDFTAASAGRAPFDIRLTFDARRDEYKVALPAGDPATPPSFAPGIARYLLPDRLVPINGMIGDLSREQTAGLSDPLQKARKIYEYVIAHMHYDHDGTGWGHGDAIFACTMHHGNCTDFHSLFIGMARAAGVPARFEIGFAIPPGQDEGKLSGYHCWAEFYIQGTGWIPIDASEAWQNPAKHDYYFGALDPNRVRFTRGRDLTLDPAQAGGAVNYIVYPYAELDRKAFSGITQEFSFRDLPM